MQTDVCIKYQEALDVPHHGRPTIIETIYTGDCGCPHILIDPDFLCWAYSHRTVSGIAYFLGVHRDTVWSALLEHSIAEPQENLFKSHPEEPAVDVPPLEDDELLNLHFTLPDVLPSNIQPPGPLMVDSINAVSDITSYTGPLSSISDTDLNDFIIWLHCHFRRAGISMLDSMLHRLGQRIAHECIRALLMHIDPIQWVFQCIQIRWQIYTVAGPMSLWHHDGQHGIFILSSLFSSWFEVKKVWFTGALWYMASSMVIPNWSLVFMPAITILVPPSWIYFWQLHISMVFCLV